MIVFGILLIIIAIGLIIGLLIDNNNYDGVVVRALFGFFASIVLIFAGIAAINFGVNPKPSALDVYRGKTELQITKKVVNNTEVSADSIVVYIK